MAWELLTKGSKKLTEKVRKQLDPYSATYPCESVSLAELEVITKSLTRYATPIFNILRKGTCRVSEDEIPWSQLQSLAILGDTDNALNNELQKVGFLIR